MSGNEQQSVNCIPLSDTATTLTAGWYVADGTVSFNQSVSVEGDVHIVLKDDAVVNIGTEESPVDGVGIGIGNDDENCSISIYGQSTGANNGQLNVYATETCIRASDGDFNCSSARVTATSTSSAADGICAIKSNSSINLKDATVNTTGQYGLYAQGNVTIDGGEVTATGHIYGIHSKNGAVTISGGEVKATGKRGIYAESGITISGGTVGAKGSNYGIYVQTGDVIISGGQVIVEGTAYKVIYASRNITLGWTRSTDYILSSSYGVGDDYDACISIAEGKSFIDVHGTTYSGTIAFENAPCAIDNKMLFYPIALDVDYLDMNGEQKTCPSYIPLTGTETSLAADWYVAEGTVSFDHHVSLEGDVHIVLKDGAVVNIGTAESPIVGFGIGDDSANHSISIYGQSTGANSGQLNVYATKTCIWAFNGDFNCSSARVTATPTSSGAFGIWALNYKVSGTGNINMKNATVNATGTYGLYAQNGDATIDGGKVTATGTAYNFGLFVHGGKVTISDGEVTATGGNAGIYAEEGSVTISGGKVMATGNDLHGIHSKNGAVTISGGEVRATGNYYAIYAQTGHVIISGGQVSASSGHVIDTGNNSFKKSIGALDGNIILNWTSPTDYIFADGYSCNNGGISIAEDKTFIDQDGTTYSGPIALEDVVCAIDGKTFRPYSSSMLFLADDADNTAVISKFNGQKYNVTLAGRTLYKDGAWNTLCLPFAVALDGSPLEGADIRTLSSASFSGGTLTLNFTPASGDGAVTAIETGKPYIVKWDDADDNVENPVFTNVTIKSGMNDVTCTFDGGSITFKGTYAQTAYTAENRSILFLGEDNTLYYPSPSDDKTPTVGAFRSYFLLDGITAGDTSDAVRTFVLNFGDGSEDTSIKEIDDLTIYDLRFEAGAWFDLNGRRLVGQPTKKGLYINNGKKVAKM